MSRDILRETIPRRADGLLSLACDVISTNELQKNIYRYWRPDHNTVVVSTDDVITDTIVLPTSVIGRTMRINVRVNLYCETTDSSRDIMLSIQDDDDSIESSRVLGQIASSVSGIDRSCLL